MYSARFFNWGERVRTMDGERFRGGDCGVGRGLLGEAGVVDLMMLEGDLIIR
jgi:hypothetical protein